MIRNSNRLTDESSPYLLMHAHNPVDWYPWGEEAFKKARAENKLIIVSIGYAACHWCHVMEHESFSDEEVALTMNQHFVSIKVDREERPDIDSIYMNAVQIISGQGGWPLNAIILPDGKPVYATTYLPKENWIYLLNQLQQLYAASSDKLVDQAKEITDRIQQYNTYFVNPSISSINQEDTIYQTFRNLLKSLDFKNGGLNSASKFPMPSVFEYLLNYFHFSKEIKALEAATLTLDKMAMGGIYDQIGGGFARYSTDSYWKIPHFEKMLYDNSQLICLYANAFRITRNESYAQIIRETMEFISREMTSDESGFYSAIDADSDGIEGKFYVWGYDEFKTCLSEEEYYLLDYFSLKPNGNWEQQKNILFRLQVDSIFLSEKGISSENFKSILSNIKIKLLQHRNNRIKPLTDTKIITSWNAIMIKACLDAYKTLGDENYLKLAIANANFIHQKLSSGNLLFRNYKDGKRYTNAKLDDYANVISAFIALYQTGFEEQWLKLANNLTEHTIQHFYDQKSGMFYYTSDLDEKLITRQFEIPDQVMPSSNSVMALNLYYLGFIYGREEFISLSEKMLSNVQVNILESPAYFGNWAKLQMLFASKPIEVAIVGKNSVEINKELNQHFFPDIIVSGSTNASDLPLLQHKYIENKTSIYICRNKVCGLPINNLSEALEVIKANSKILQI